ncbi:MAG: MmgE/PrpD family protein [Acidobacteriia bacterium]|nr:MmgE/PrpD family protein [Terriglobia bacterium]
MTIAEELAAFAVQASCDQLSQVASDQLKIRVLDSLGCALGALGGEPVRMV